MHIVTSFILGNLFTPEQASTYAPSVDHLYYYLVGWTFFFVVTISIALIYFSVRFRRRHPNEIPKPNAGSIKLELAWTIIPFFIEISMFVWGASIYFTEYTPPRDALDVYVVAKQWMWKFQHPEGQREINELHVPMGQKVRLTLATEDVIHSFYIPAFRIKQDVVPGPNRYTTIWFEATKPGTYHIFCAEYCGTSHSKMIGWITVMGPKDYQSWLSGGASEGSMASNGLKVFQNLGCATCHQATAQGRGPVLDGMFGKEQQMSDGSKVVVDESYLRESILNPQAKIVAGFQPIMPTFQGQVSEEQLLQLIAYIKSIGAPQISGSASATSTNQSIPIMQGDRMNPVIVLPPGSSSSMPSGLNSVPANNSVGNTSMQDIKAMQSNTKDRLSGTSSNGKGTGK